MANLVKRKVLIIGICCLGCGLSLGSLALAQNSRIYISNIFKEFTRLRTVSGLVTYNGNGLDNVGIYDGTRLLGVTNALGFYMVALEAYGQDGSLYSRVVTGADGKYSIDVPKGWTGRVQPYRQGFEFFPAQNPYFNLNQDQTFNYQAPHTLDYRVTVRIRDQNGNKLPINEHVRIDFNGIDHAAGSHDFWYMDRDTGELFWDFRSGWIGEITPSNHQVQGPILYNFNPPFIRMSAPIASDMTFSFTATPQ